MVLSSQPREVLQQQKMLQTGEKLEVEEFRGETIREDDRRQVFHQVVGVVLADGHQKGKSEDVEQQLQRDSHRASFCSEGLRRLSGSPLVACELDEFFGHTVDLVDTFFLDLRHQLLEFGVPQLVAAGVDALHEIIQNLQAWLSPVLPMNRVCGPSGAMNISAIRST